MSKDHGLEMRWVFLEWDGVWAPRLCPYTEERYQPTCDWLQRHSQQLPVPRANIGATIRFRWGKGQLIGEVRAVHGTWRDASKFVIAYLARVNGRDQEVEESLIL